MIRILVLLGILILVYSLFIIRQLHKMADNFQMNKNFPKIRYYSIILFALIIFFILGYILFLLTFYFPQWKFLPSETIVSVVFFLGALFVVIVLKIGKIETEIITASLSKLKQSNKEISMEEKVVVKDKIKLERLEKQLEHKNAELNKKNKELATALDDFYTLRLSLENSVKAKEIEKENKEIKSRIDRLKKE